MKLRLHDTITCIFHLLHGILKLVISFFRLGELFQKSEELGVIFYLLLHQLRNDPVIQRFKQFQS